MSSLLQVGKAVVTDFSDEKVWIDLVEVSFPCFNEGACQGGGTVMFWMNPRTIAMRSTTTTGIGMEEYTDLYVHYFE